MAKLGTLTLTGRSGQDYVFYVYPFGTPFEAAGAVYYISKRTPKPDGSGLTHTTIYIGETGNLSERFDAHHKAACFKRHDANAISIYWEDDEEERLSIEADLVAAKNPPCND